ncbi:MAG: AtpZ/AtpI family protein [Proteobacteria bacterium]|nr:AtpZ/AtpI family protein [Pseudomonadota bacterium]
MRKSTRDSFRLLAVASTMGLAMVISTVLGLALGYVLDHYVFHTEPVLTLVFLVLGIIGGFRNLYILTKRIQRMEKEAE